MAAMRILQWTLAGRSGNVLVWRSDSTRPAGWHDSCKAAGLARFLQATQAIDG